MKRLNPRYVPHNELDRLTMEANAYVPPKKTRAKRIPCPHLNFWETATPAGQRMRKCQMCPRVEVHVNGDWQKVTRPKTMNPSPTPHAKTTEPAHR